MQVYFMRHGQTNYNRRHLCNDNPAIDVHLSETGQQQALIAAEQLRNIAIERIIVSELPRTRQTADIINQYHRVKIETSSMINDIRSGFDGRPVEEYMSAIAHDRLHASCNGGESLLHHKQRILGFIGWLKRQNEKVVLVIAHEETLRVAAGYYKNLSDQDMLDQTFANCEYFSFEL